MRRKRGRSSTSATKEINNFFFAMIEFPPCITLKLSDLYLALQQSADGQPVEDDVCAGQNFYICAGSS